MIFGACPYCDHPMTFPMPDQSPAFSRQTCDACGKTFWEYHSRVYSEAYTLEAFTASFEVDEGAMTIRAKEGAA